MDALVVILSVMGWVICAISLLMGCWFAVGIRLSAIRRISPPMWPTLITAFALIFYPILLLVLSLHKLHIAWILPLTWFLSFAAGVRHVPFISKMLIWPAYVYASILMIGTGVRLTSPNKQSPWAAKKSIYQL